LTEVALTAKRFPMSDTQVNRIVKLSDTYSLTEAASKLGFDSFRSVKHLVKKGVLKSYKTKFSKYQRVLKKEVEALTELEEA